MERHLHLKKKDIGKILIAKEIQYSRNRIQKETSVTEFISYFADDR